ncbi:hypothetical protein D9756_003058 [Leucocoprinus leucothites]|uniref:Major facilitator superfamily (MFS) profile domain-containing protein n=1 Tax=Leucocoprinus leucothites TaxID=201217 RepID=A0A8H5G6L5_9AGAR|nr:hypothetical protein D9756_003058 [Leucoagaricus leucothites]
MTDNNQSDVPVVQEIERYEAPKSTTAAAQAGDCETIDAEEPRTPLPKFQLFIVLLIQFSEPITAVVIYPFVNQFVRDTGITGGDDRKTGYYAGVIESAFFFAEAATVFLWGWLSDRFGRRPILLLGPFGLTFAMLRFGYSTSFWPMVLSRCFQGVFNGNIGVSKTVMVELSDSSNIGDAFSMMPLMWSAGVTLGPIMGGVLSNPATRWPNVFGKIAVFVQHPYFLPCLVAGIISFFTFVIGFVGLKETLSSRIPSDNSTRDEERRRDSTDALLDHNDTPDYGTTATSSSTRAPSPSSSATLDSPQKPTDANTWESTSLSTILKSSRMQLIIANYTFLMFTDMCYVVLMPLMYSTSIETGGLGLDPYQIGMIMGVWGFCNAFVQINLVGKAIRRYGGASVYKVAYACYLISLLTFPMSSYFAQKNGGVGFGSGVMIALQLIFQFFAYMGYASIQVVIADAAPKSLLGSINGLVQMSGCIMRTIAPTFASSLFSMSIEDGILGGYMVYVVIYAILLVGIACSTRLMDQRSRQASRSA